MEPGVSEKVADLERRLQINFLRSTLLALEGTLEKLERGEEVVDLFGVARCAVRTHSLFLEMILDEASRGAGGAHAAKG